MPSRFALYSPRFAQHILDMPLLDHVQIIGVGPTRWIQCAWHLRGVNQILRQVVGRDCLPFGQDLGAFEHIREFANIPWPVVGTQNAKSIRLDREGSLLKGPGFEQMIGQPRDIFAVLLAAPEDGW